MDSPNLSLLLFLRITTDLRTFSTFVPLAKSICHTVTKPLLIKSFSSSFFFSFSFFRMMKMKEMNNTNSNDSDNTSSLYYEQCFHRLNHMPWLYDIEKHKMFAKERQKKWQEKLMQMETIEIKGEDTYISDENVHIFAERGRKVVIENNCRIASGCFIHGPCVLEENVGLNQSVHMDGGSGKGIHIGCDTRIGPSTSIFAFNHSFDDLTTPVRLQKVKSKGVTIGRDVWIGANVSIVDGVTIGSHAVVGIASVVTKDIPEYEIWAGNPAKKIGKRGD